MKKFKFPAVLLFPFVTCGIYGLYFIIKSTSNHNELAETYKVPTIKPFIIAFLLGLPTCSIYLIIWWFKYLNQMIKIATAREIHIPTGNLFLFFLLTLVPFYGLYVLVKTHNDIIVEAE